MSKPKGKITVTHSAEESSCCCCLPAYKYRMEVEGSRNYSRKKLACRSFPLESRVMMNYLALVLIVCVIDILFKRYGEEYSFSSSNPDSMKNLQTKTPAWVRELLMLQSPLGGGAELNIATLLALIFLPRSRFFYYMTVAGMEQVITLQLRMFFGDPRPFHIDQKISPWMCYSTYGNPGDHAVAGATAAIVIFLDIFHGTPVSYSYDNQIFHGWLSYLFSFLFGIYWAITMPYTRYLGGIQSMDQLIFGATLGVLLGFFCHFVVRDHLIGYFEKLQNWQNESKGLLNFIKDRSDDPEVGDSEYRVKEMGYMRVFPMTLEGAGEDRGEEKEYEFSPFKFIVYVILVWLIVMSLGTIAFIVDSIRFPEDSQEISIWLKNLKFHGCGEYQYEETFHNKMFINVARITFHLSSMIFFTQRKLIGLQLVYNYKIQDGSNINYQDKRVAFFQILNRMIVLGMIVSIYVLADKSGQLMKGEPSSSLGNRFITMFQTQIVPLLIIAYLMNAGVYDLLVHLCQKFLVDKITAEKNEKQKTGERKTDKSSTTASVKTPNKTTDKKLSSKDLK